MESLLTPNALQSAIHAALRAWDAPDVSPKSLMEGLLLVSVQRQQIGEAETPMLRRLATNRVLLAGISVLETQDKTLARVLQARFIDKNKLFVVANKLNVSEHTVSRMQRTAIERLADVIHSQEMALRAEQGQGIEGRLPPASYTQLFEFETAHDELTALLSQQNRPWIVALTGLGGIGKTALADSVVRQLVHQLVFADVIWVRAVVQGMDGRSRPAHLPYEDLIITLARHFWPDVADNFPFPQRVTQVKQVLKERPFLIVIDNLESDTDTAYLLAHLNDLTSPSKFLLTSRVRPTEQVTVFNFPITELPLAAASDLLRYHAQEIGVHAMRTATSKDLTDIYQVVGGNPLALKLVVSLLDLLSLTQILTALTHNQAGPIEDLYRHIYWQSWQMLSPAARSILQAMPLVAEAGGAPDYLRAISDLSKAEFWPALQELRHRSLLEVRGTLHEKRYGIHRLTESFLQTEIIHWPLEETTA